MAGPLVEVLIDTLRLGADDVGLARRWVGMPTAGLSDLVAYEGASIWLYRRLRAIGAIEALPLSFREELRAQAFQAVGKGMRIEEEAVAVIGALAGAGFPVIALKGVARRALAARHPYLDARASNDVDLLLPNDRLDEANRFLLTSGYQPTPTGWDLGADHHHLPGLWGWRRVVVELHRTTSSMVPPEVAWERATRGSEELVLAGLPVRVSSSRELVWHAISHSVRDSVRGFRLQSFLEVAALAAAGVTLDWTSIRERSVAGEAVDPEASARDQACIALRWLDAALSLVAPNVRSKPASLPSFDLPALLEWRLASLVAQRRFGRRFADRMLEEGPRALVGLPIERAPPGAPWLNRLRRRTAGTACRVLFGAWRVTRTDRRPASRAPL